MRWTQSLIPTMRKAPERAEMISHVLMLRAGLIGQVMGGAYGYLPLGLRARRKLEQMIRQRLDAIGAVEVAMPAMTPLSLWEQSGRAEAFGEELLQLSAQRTNRRVRVVLAPSHEEAIAELAARHVGSYRQLPLLLYQITTKFRNQPRPRHGVLETSEHLVQDAYSLDTSAETLDRAYREMYAAYSRILDRCSPKHVAAEADPGLTGGETAQELYVFAEAGEEEILYCPDCGYAATRQRAEIGPLDAISAEEPLDELRKVDTPGATTIEEVSSLLGCRPQQMIKTLIYLADGQPLAVLIRGDREANEHKIRRAVGAETLELADPEAIGRVTGAPVGFAGPVGMQQKIPIWADREIRQMANAITGANAADAHYTGVNLRRDFQADRFAELRNATDGDPCPVCSSKLTERRVIRVARLVKVGTKYSEVFSARFDDRCERQHPIVLGCYQLAVDRLLAAVIETGHDKAGIIWPVALAPYEVLLLPLAADDEAGRAVAERLHDELAAAGIDVLLDDRDVRPGVKFNDADLIGIPLRVVIGQRGLKQKKLEIKWRWEEEPKMIDLAAAGEAIAELIRSHT